MREAVRGRKEKEKVEKNHRMASARGGRRCNF